MAVAATDVAAADRRQKPDESAIAAVRKPQDAPGRARPARRDARPGSKTVTIIDGIERQAPGDHDPVQRPRHAGRQDTAADDRSAAARDVAPRPASQGRAGRRAAGRGLCPPGEAASPASRTRRGSRSWSAASASARAATADALGKLPGPVTLAFAPYGSDLEQLVARARGEGHEVLLQVPMEPFDYPDNDPGPQTLLTSLDGRAEHRPPALADEPLPGLCRHREFHGRALHRVRAGAGAGAARGRQARPDLSRRRLLAAQPREPDRRRQQARRSPRPTWCIDAVPTPADIDRALGRLETHGARARHRRRHRQRACRSRSIASPNGRRPPRAAASLLVPISASWRDNEVELTHDRDQLITA